MSEAGQSREDDAVAQGDPLRSWQLLARAQRRALRGWSKMKATRRFINLLIPGVVAGLMVFAALPTSILSEGLVARHEALGAAMRQVSLGQRWLMYAPNPTRGHAYQEFIAYDADGGVRVLEESELVEEGWSSSWIWNRDRHHIWLYTIARKPKEINRNRIWFIRGLCVREARRGHAVDRIEVNRVHRRMHSPEELMATGETLGPPRKSKVVDTTCHVEIIRDMIAADPMGAAAGLAAALAAGAGEGAGG